MLRLAALIGTLVLLSFPVRASDTATALTPEQRFEAARGLMQAGKLTEAADAFRSIAESEDVPHQLREQALFVCGMMYRNARDYDRAVTVFEEVQRRFPGGEAAVRAAGSIGELRGEGGEGIEFRRRLDEAWDQMEAAKELADREGVSKTVPELERAQSLLLWLLRDFGEGPKAKDISVALAETSLLMRRYENARSAYKDAILRARREPATPALDDFVAHVQEGLQELDRVERRERITDVAMGVFAAITIGLLCTAPWRIRDVRIWRLGGIFTIASAVLGGIAAVLSHGVKRIDLMLPIEDWQAATLVALPSIVGAAVTLGFIGALPQRKVHTIAAVLGVIAAVAISLCLVNAFGLFSYLDSNL